MLSRKQKIVIRHALNKLKGNEFLNIPTALSMGIAVVGEDTSHEICADWHKTCSEGFLEEAKRCYLILWRLTQGYWYTEQCSKCFAEDHWDNGICCSCGTKRPPERQSVYENKYVM